MNVAVQKSFEKDVLKVADKKLAKQLSELIEELESCKTLSDVNHLKKMKAKGNYYRIRVGNYRVGIKLEKGIIVLLRMMHRKDIYNFFP